MLGVRDARVFCLDSAHRESRVSALANSAALHGRDTGFMLWGIEDGTKRIVGTTFQPRQTKKGAGELEHWLVRSLHPQVNLQIHEWTHNGHALVLMEVSRATYAPMRFGSEAFLRIGSLTNKLKDYSAKEAALWASFSKNPFETGIAKADLGADEVLALLDLADKLPVVGFASSSELVVRQL